MQASQWYQYQLSSVFPNVNRSSWTPAKIPELLHALRGTGHWHRVPPAEVHNSSTGQRCHCGVVSFCRPGATEEPPGFAGGSRSAPLDWGSCSVPLDSQACFFMSNEASVSCGVEEVAASCHGLWPWFCGHPFLAGHWRVPQAKQPFLVSLVSPSRAIPITCDSKNRVIDDPRFRDTKHLSLHAR